MAGKLGAVVEGDGLAQAAGGMAPNRFDQMTGDAVGGLAGGA